MVTEFVICFPGEEGINLRIRQIVGLTFSEHFTDAEAALEVKSCVHPLCVSVSACDHLARCLVTECETLNSSSHR